MKERVRLCTVVNMESKKEKCFRPFRVPVEIHQTFHSLAIGQGKKVPELLREIVEEYVARETTKKGRR